MPKTCIVPGCDTGTRRCKRKYSVFNVTADDNLRTKWEAAIPGIQCLKSSQHICERHFKDDFIVRKWVKHDLNGKIIAEVPYKRIRLMECAVPSIFNDQDSKESMVVKSIDVSNNVHEEGVLGLTSIGREPERLVNEGVDYKNRQIGILVGNHSIDSTHRENETNRDKQHINETRSSVPVATEVKNNHRLQNDRVTEPHPIMDCASTKMMSNADVCTTSRRRVNSDLPTKSLIAQSINSTRIPSAIVEATKIEAKDFGESFVKFMVKQGIQIHSRTDSDLLKDNSVTSLPSSWSATIVPRTETLVISEVFADTENHIPVLRKSMTIDRGRTITYYVHGIVAKKNQLPQLLNTPEILSTVIMQFRSLRVCDGLGDVNVCLAQANVTLKDNMNIWRANDCSLIGRRKKCNICVKLRKVLKQKNVRYAKRESFKRVSVASNPIDQSKLNIMRKRINLERRQKNRKARRIKILTDHLSALKDELADIRNQSLDESYSIPDVPDT